MKHPPLRRRTRHRWPWQTDPDDREASYRRPIRTDEKVRLVIKGAAAVAAFLWIRWATGGGGGVGAKLAIGVGAALAVAGALDLAWTLRGRLDHVFIDSRRLQIAAHSGMLALGAAMLVGGTLALP